ncbi:hypothetical protein [Streptomyces resistomycificus]|uniref:Uncharacterized protein n=1 Tax=Streptomyces resistomycificus TaxID=67356 RepID=A0A0L8L8Z2_9ACTN|nr:hypothetical protein [Streptomyces resistomycificus]KOG34648.1 hypothetical protein ADK37_17645 [Streptomyces resistomycificus]KUN93308.1 hypothetical protein AQJ84_29960 [Streptomyces resistomycificus]
MGVPGELAEEIELVDAMVKRLARRPIDFTDPDWHRRLREGPRPLDEANVREEAEAALSRLLDLYERGDEQTRSEVRALLERCHSFHWATGLPAARTPDGFRRHVVYLSARDHGRDTRDEMVASNRLCEQARGAQVDTRPLLLEVAEISGDEERYGMGSIRQILLRAAGRDPAGLW